jgi:glutaredoxin
MSRITLISRDGCHLCAVAEQTLDRVTADTGESWVRVDVDADDELVREYSDRVPVLLLDGREHGYWRVDEERLRRDLARPAGAPPY